MLINYTGDSKVIKRICELINTMTGVNFEVVQTLPTVDISTSTIYLLPKQDPASENIYDEYINTDGTSQGWELIGTTEIDLTNYYTKTETDGLIQNLDGVIEGAPNAGRTLTAFSEIDGVVSAKFEDININAGQITNTCIVGTDSTITAPTTWHKVASATITTANTDAVILMAINDTFRDEFEDSNAGLIYCNLRQSSLGAIAYAKLKMAANSGWDSDKFRLYVIINPGTSITAEIWTSVTRRYQFRRFTLINQGGRTATYSNDWTLYNSTAPTNAPTESANCIKYNCEDIISKNNLDAAETGTWNLLREPYGHTSGRTSYGVTFTVDSSGQIIANGRATGTASFSPKLVSQNWTLPAGKAYRLTGCPSGGSNSTYRINIGFRDSNNQDITVFHDFGDGLDFIVPNNAIITYIQLNVLNGYQATDLIFTPKIYPVTFPGCDKTNAGIYTLQATVDANGQITYTWV